MFKITVSEIKDYLSGIKNFPNYKIEEYLFIRKNKDLALKTIDSKCQIKELLKIVNSYSSVYNRYSAPNIETDLIEILTKFKDKKYCDMVREKINKPFKDDDEIYQYLKTIQSYKTSLIHPKFLPNAAQIVAQNIGYELKNFTFKNYLDIGAGDGYKTKLIAEQFKIDLKNVHAIDYTKFDDREYKREKEIVFHNIKNKKTILPFEDNTFDLVSSLMVFHHITDDETLDFTLREIVRVLKPGACFMLKEHNCMSVIDCMLSDIEHCMYEIVFNKIPNYEFRKENYSRYFSWVEWDIILKKYGFVKNKMTSMDYSVLGKINASKH